MRLLCPRAVISSLVVSALLAPTGARADAPATSDPAPPTENAATSPNGAASVVTPRVGAGTETPEAPPGTPAPSLALDAPSQPSFLVHDPPPGRRPFYRRAWFWAAVGVIAVTVTIILVANANSGPNTPSTDLHDMHAF